MILDFFDRLFTKNDVLNEWEQGYVHPDTMFVLENYRSVAGNPYMEGRRNALADLGFLRKNIFGQWERTNKQIPVDILVLT